MDLEAFFKEYPDVAVAFSGGVDSAYLLYAAARYASSVRAYYVRSAFQPQFEREDARQVAEQLGVALTVLPVDVLADPEVTENPENRCYFCKKRIFSRIMAVAREDGFSVVLDGTNASDDAGDRPGMRALQELEVLSPLRLCGLTKDAIRKAAKEADLPVWNKPAYACLATRIPTGEKITAEKLQKTEAAEAYLFSLGLRDFRVRYFCGCAKLQVPVAQMPLVLSQRAAILRTLRQWYPAVLLDLEARG